MSRGGAPKLPVVDSLPEPLTLSSVRTTHHDENYMQELLRESEPLSNDVNFIVPNLVTQHGKSSDAEGWMRWHVPTDDNSHEEFTIQFSGGMAISGAPLYNARESLIKAVKDIG